MDLDTTKMGDDSSAENIPNALNFSPICVPKPKSLKLRKEKLSQGIRSLRAQLKVFPWFLVKQVYHTFHSNGFLTETPHGPKIGGGH